MPCIGTWSRDVSEICSSGALNPSNIGIDVATNLENNANPKYSTPISFAFVDPNQRNHLLRYIFLSY